MYLFIYNNAAIILPFLDFSAGKKAMTDSPSAFTYLIPFL